MLRSLMVVTALTILAGCAGGLGEGPLTWVRTDGQSGRANPALADQFAADRAACGVTGVSDNAALRTAEPCMRRRGYVLVPASEAEATAAKFRSSESYPKT